MLRGTVEMKVTPECVEEALTEWLQRHMAADVAIVVKKVHFVNVSYSSTPVEASSVTISVQQAHPLNTGTPP